jgi:ABC-2 type transport system ATP-binding protein
VIEVSHLTKRYGDHVAINDLNFTIENGHIYGFLGPNGAGKSTTMNILTGCLAATEGQVLIDGYDIFEEAEKAKRLIGYLPEQPPLYLDMTPDEFLQFVAKAKGVSKADLPAQLSYVKEVTQITDVSQRLIKNLSKGYKQRVGIAQALLGKPDVIILDEPTVGLDPKQITEIRDLIKSLGEKHTVILSSHILSEVRAICDMVMIISSGELVACDTPDNLENLFTGEAVLELLVKADEQLIKSALSTVGGISKTAFSKCDDGLTRVSISTKSDNDIREAVFFAFTEVHCPVLSMNVAKASLEDIFLELTSGKDVQSFDENKAEAEKAEANPDKEEAGSDESDI